MKFILITVLAFMIETSFAQVKLNESFEATTFPPTGWVKKGGNLQNGGNWSRGLSSMYVQLAHTGQAGAISESCIYPTNVTPNNWLITPALNIQTGDSLEFFIKNSSSQYPSEHFELRISTSTNDTSSFSAPIYEHSFISSESAAWLQKVFNLNQYAGQTIYIAFIHNKCFGQDMLFLDDVKVWHTIGTGIIEKNTDIPYVFNNNILRFENTASIKQLTIYDIAGKLIIDNTENGLQKTYNLSNLQKGIYIINVISKENIVTSFKVSID